MANGDDDDDVFDNKKTAPAASWGFGKLWGDATTKASPSVPHSATLAPQHATPSPAPPPMLMPATPLSRKLSGSSGSRTPSISSTASTPVPPLHSNAALSIRESIYSTSDASSVVEPVSPPEEFSTNIVVRDVTNLSDTSSGKATSCAIIECNLAQALLFSPG
ncbi:hypothetical protein DXG01_006375 [Tephrocybe rancida]|nr:hypothetical protein DXG01_006375 [Tephrocybe rancida]